MGLDIVVMERKDVRCPHCGEVINTVDIASTDSGGRAWYEFLENIGYCVPYGKRTEEKIGTVWTWFLTTSRQSSLQTTP